MDFPWCAPNSCTGVTISPTTYVSEIHKHKYLSAAWSAFHLKDVAVFRVSSETPTCRLFKRLLDHPMTDGLSRGVSSYIMIQHVII